MCEGTWWEGRKEGCSLGSGTGGKLIHQPSITALAYQASPLNAQEGEVDRLEQEGVKRSDIYM